MYDENNNAIEVLEGFKVKDPAEDETIIYDYLEDKSPAVQDGIVIEDDLGNQFVWIPVGTEENAIKDNNGEKTEIALGRYTFGDNGTPSKVYECNDVIDGLFVEESVGEHNVSKLGNVIAENIGAFKSSAEVNHGYYIARYEAGNNNGKATSRQGAIWSNLKQSNAASAARVMYNSENFESDLINSLAWDTAIVFIQKYSGDNDYSKQNSINTSGPLTTGERNGTNDKVCNIYDMASNCWEWTTESCKQTDCPCVQRGGVCNKNTYFTSYRSILPNTYYVVYNGFRVALYVITKE